METFARIEWQTNADFSAAINLVCITVQSDCRTFRSATRLLSFANESVAVGINYQLLRTGKIKRRIRYRGGQQVF